MTTTYAVAVVPKTMPPLVLPPKKVKGPVQQTLERALELFGDTGEHWIKGSLVRIGDDGKLTMCSLGALVLAQRELRKEREGA